MPQVILRSLLKEQENHTSSKVPDAIPSCSHSGKLDPFGSSQGKMHLWCCLQELAFSGIVTLNMEAATGHQRFYKPEASKHLCSPKWLHDMLSRIALKEEATIKTAINANLLLHQGLVWDQVGWPTHRQLRQRYEAIIEICNTVTRALTFF